MEGKKTIRIKCPQCGAILKVGVSSSADLTKGKLTCPKCKFSNSIADFKTVVEKPVHDETQIVSTVHDVIGHLIDDATGKEYPLREGRLLIGRLSSSAKGNADVMIETEDKGFSRSQFYIRVIKGGDGRYHTYISEASRSNPTCLNGKKLRLDDENGLKHNDLITASETSLRFMGTRYDDRTLLGPVSGRIQKSKE